MVLGEETRSLEVNSVLLGMIRDSFKRIDRDAEKNLSKTGLSFAEFRILNLLHDGSCSMSRLSTEIALTQAGITGVVDKLEAHGFVERVRSNEDRRVVTISITSKGQEILRKAQRVHKEFVERSLGSLDPEELRELSLILRKLADVTDELIAG